MPDKVNCLQFTASYSVKQITVYSNLLFQQINVYINLPCQANFRLQQCTVSSKLQFTAIYRVNQIIIYSNLPFTAIYRVKQITCQANYSLQQFTVSSKLQFTAIYREILIQPTISLEMPVPSQGHYGFHSFRLLTDFVCLYNYEF
jgi:hypothetical protein